MTIAGLWHGPSWTFVLFGALHGAGLVVNQYWRKKKMPKLPAPASWLLTFLLVNTAFIFFRSRTLYKGAQMVTSLVSPHHPLGVGVLTSDWSSFTSRLAASLLLGVIFAFYGKESNELTRDFKPTYWGSFAVAAMVFFSWVSMVFNKVQSFVYFKF